MAELGNLEKINNYLNLLLPLYNVRANVLVNLMHVYTITVQCITIIFHH